MKKFKTINTSSNPKLKYVTVEDAKQSLKILGKVKKLLRYKSNWIQGKYNKLNKNGKYQYCILGALDSIKRDMFITSEKFLHMCLPKGDNFISVFNDSKKTEHQDILDYLNHTISEIKRILSLVPGVLK